jgi:hypothetical protein
MPRIVRCGLIQANCKWATTKFSLEKIKEKMIGKHEKLISDAANRKVQILPPPIARAPNNPGRPEHFTGRIISAVRAAGLSRTLSSGSARAAD